MRERVREGRDWGAERERERESSSSRWAAPPPVLPAAWWTDHYLYLHYYCLYIYYYYLLLFYYCLLFAILFLLMLWQYCNDSHANKAHWIELSECVCVCVCVCEWERERERKRVCVRERSAWLQPAVIGVELKIARNVFGVSVCLSTLWYECGYSYIFRLWIKPVGDEKSAALIYISPCLAWYSLVSSQIAKKQ